jgi:hypothetical protein
MPKQVWNRTLALTKAGLKVALVEAGPRLRAGIDYNSHDTPFSSLDERLSKGLQPSGGAEFFNIFNHPNFSAVGAGFAIATFGHVTAALDPREIQFSARLSF